MAGARFKQGQVKGAIAGHRSKATLVYCAEDVEEGDILCVTGMTGDFLTVMRAQCGHTATIDASIGTVPCQVSRLRGPFFVADFDAPSGFIGPVAVDSKIITFRTDSDDSGGLLTSIGTPGAAVLIGGNGKVRMSGTAQWDGSPLTQVSVQAGHVLVRGNASTGKVLLEPGRSNNVPINFRIVGKADGSSSSTVTVTGWTDSTVNGIFAVSKTSDLSVLRAYNNSGTLTIKLSGSLPANSSIACMIQR